MTAIRTIGLLVASLALMSIAEAQKGGGKPGGKNTPPTGSISDISVTVNSPDSVIDLYAAYSDAEDPDTALSYAVNGNTNPTLFNSVTIDSANGTLTLSYAADAVGVADVTVQVTDTGGKTLIDVFTVAVLEPVIFQEDFNFGFNEYWTSDRSLHPLIGADYVGIVVTGGSPTITFRTDGETLRLYTQKPPQKTSYSFVSLDTFSAVKQVQARFNTMVQGSGSLDGLFHVFLVNASDPTKFVGIYPYAACNAACSQVIVHSTNGRHTINYSFQNNTWYRLFIINDPDIGLVAKIVSDDGLTVHGSHTLNLPLSNLGSSFRVGFGQNMGLPNITQDLDGVVDFIRVEQP